MLDPLDRPPAEACRVVLVRHAATANNERNPPVLQGRGLNPGLSERGRRQAAATAEALRAWSFDACYSSPLVRAVETAAAIVARRATIAVQTIEALTEVDLGRWEGRTWPEVERENPTEYRAFVDDPEVNPYLGGESFGDVARRVGPAVEALADRHPGGTILVVGHNAVNRVLVAQGLGTPVSAARRLQLSNAGICLLVRRGRTWSAPMVNAVLHLAGLAP
jgi:broad specificity phosphatase PhoE